LHTVVFAVSSGKGCAKEVRNRRIAIDPGAEIINIELCDCITFPFDVGDCLGLIFYLAIRPGPNVIVS
jgi:hypothetical protein